MTDTEGSSVQAGRLVMGLLPPAIRQAILSGELSPAPYEGQETRHEQDARRRKWRQDLIAVWRAQVPPLYAAAAVQHLPDAQRTVVVQWWNDTTQTVLLVRGAVGLGKTWLAYALGDHAVTSGAPAMVVPAVTYLDLVRSAAFGRAADDALNPDASDVVNGARSKSFFALDDFGADRPSEWVQAHLTQLLDYRITRGLRTMLTTNADTRTLLTLYGPRVVSRLSGTYCTTLQLSGRDLRPNGGRP